MAALALVFAAYANSFHNSFHFDDYHIIVNNPKVHRLSDLQGVISANYFRPVLFLTFALNFHYGGSNAFGYHLVNVALHLLNLALIFFLFRRLLVYVNRRAGEAGSTWKAHDPFLPALLAVVLFGTHPLQTESVTYIASRSSVLSSTFVLLTVAAFLQARLAGGGEGPAGSAPVARRGLWLAAGTVAFILGAATKELGVCAPLLLLLLEATLFSAGRMKDFWKNLLRFHLPFLVLIAAGATLRLAFMFRLHNPAEFRSPWHNLLTQFGVITRYVGLVFLPIRQNVDPDIPLSTSLFELRVLLPLAFLAGLIYLGWRLRRSEPLAAAGIFWWFIALLPTSSIIPLRDLMAEHSVYLALVGGAMALGLVPEMLLGRGAAARRAATVAALLLGSVLAMTTYQRNKVWLSELTLWQDAASKSPEKERPLMHYGNAIFAVGKIRESLALYEKVLRLNPENITVRFNMGIIYKRLGDPDRAAAEWRRVAEKDPGFINVHNNLGNYHLARGEREAARREYWEEVAHNPGNPLGFFNLGNLCAQEGEHEKAIGHWRRALRFKTDLESCRLRLGSLLFDLGRYTEAREEFETILRFRPESAPGHFNLGNVHYREGRLAEAVAQYQRSAELDPAFADPLINAGMLYAGPLSQPQRAADLLREALRRKPDHPRAAAVRETLSRLAGQGASRPGTMPAPR